MNSSLPTWTSMTMVAWSSMSTGCRTTMFGMLRISIVLWFLKQYISPNQYCLGVFICPIFTSILFFHPPKFLPISIIFSDNIIYFSVGINLFSQAICKKKERVLSLTIACPSRISFLSVWAKVAWCIISRTETKEFSILAPSPKRATLGIWGAIKIQSLKADLSFWMTRGSAGGVLS